MKPSRKKHLCRMCHITLATFLSVYVSAQNIQKGGWQDFGITQEDTVIHINCTDLSTNNRSHLFYADFRHSFKISFSACFNTQLTEQVFLCKEGLKGEIFADLMIGFDPGTEQIFAEIKDNRQKLHRIFAGEKAEKGKWFDITLQSEYKSPQKESEMTLTVRSCDTGKTATSRIDYPGFALTYNVTKWVIGRGFPGGFPNSLQVRNGLIRNLKIEGIGKERVKGQNPIFTDRFTADPACTVVGDRIYAFVGEDKAGVGGWFNMPHWVLYSSADMINWTDHGVILKASDFPHANPYGAWAAQMVEKDGLYYYYVTLDDTRNGKHMIDVAVSNNPTGPYKPARQDGTPLVTDDMTPDSHRKNADIDPTVFIDDDGTPWMAWGNGDCYMVRLKPNMIELDGEIRHIGLRNYSEGPWLFKRKNLYYLVYAADAPGVQAEQIAYSTATSIEGPWTYRGLLTTSAKYGFTIHPSVNEFKGKWYFFYHDGSYMLNGEPGGDCRRQVCVEEMKFNKDGTIQPITLTEKGIADK